MTHSDTPPLFRTLHFSKIRSRLAPFNIPLWVSSEVEDEPLVNSKHGSGGQAQCQLVRAPYRRSYYSLSIAQPDEVVNSMTDRWAQQSQVGSVLGCPALVMQHNVRVLWIRVSGIPWDAIRRYKEAEGVGRLSPGQEIVNVP